MSNLLERYYASNPVGEMNIHTFELINEDFVDAQGNPASHRLVNKVAEPLLCTLETGATATFEPAAIQATFPEEGANGSGRMRLVIDGVSLEIVRQLKRRSRGGRGEIICIYREYLESDLTKPYKIQRMTLEDISAGQVKVEADASQLDPTSIPYPDVLYTVDTHPGLISS